MDYRGGWQGTNRCNLCGGSKFVCKFHQNKHQLMVSSRLIDYYALLSIIYQGLLFWQAWFCSYYFRTLDGTISNGMGLLAEEGLTGQWTGNVSVFGLVVHLCCCYCCCLPCNCTAPNTHALSFKCTASFVTREMEFTSKSNDVPRHRGPTTRLKLDNQTDDGFSCRVLRPFRFDSYLIG